MSFVSARCPVDEVEKQWIEKWMLWFIEQFGADTLQKPIVLPEPEYFPEEYHGTPACARKVLARVCQYMGVPPDSAKLDVFTDPQRELAEHLPPGRVGHAGAAGLYGHSTPGGRFLLAVEASQLRDGLALIAVLAHEVGHILLLGSGRLRGDERDHEHLTDLVTVFFGLGIISANAAYQFHQWQTPSKQGWRVSRHGYMSESMYGYALASFAWMRGERRPPWVKYLQPNVRTYLKEALTYVHRTGDTILPVYPSAT
jgi:hypothetical protein